VIILIVVIVLVGKLTETVDKGTYHIKNNGYLYVITRVSGVFYLKMKLNDALIGS